MAMPLAEVTIALLVGGVLLILYLIYRRVSEWGDMGAWLACDLYGTV